MSSLPAVTGWVSLALGLPLLTRPALGAAVGFGADRRLVRAAGMADLAIGAGLLLGRDPARWTAARMLGDAAFAGLCARTIARGGPHRPRAAGMFGLMATLTLINGVVARRLRRDRGEGFPSPDA